MTHYLDPEYCFLSEGNPVQKKPKQILLPCCFGVPDPRPQAPGSARALCKPLGAIVLWNTIQTSIATKMSPYPSQVTFRKNTQDTTSTVGWKTFVSRKFTMKMEAAGSFTGSSKSS
jgi:hypothetical protein